MKKITCAIYNKLLQKALLFFLLSANFIFAADNFAFFSNSTITTSFSQAPVCNGVSFLNYSKKNSAFLDSTVISIQDLFLGFEKITHVVNLPKGLKNIDNIIHKQNSVVLALDETGVNFI